MVDSVAAIARTAKVIVRRERMEHYVLSEDPGESRPTGADLDDFAVQLQRAGVPASVRMSTVAHLRHWGLSIFSRAAPFETPPREGGSSGRTAKCL